MKTPFQISKTYRPQIRSTKARLRHLTLGALLIALSPTAKAAPAPPLAAGDLRRSGTIVMEIVCAPAVKEDYEASVALLHSFFYDEARRRFLDITMRDPDCAMAWWGVAMTWFHPLWAPPTIVERARGLEAITKAKALGAGTEIGTGLIDAVEAYYTATEIPYLEDDVIAGCSCCGPQAHSARARAFHEAMDKLHKRFPDNVEVTVFYALAKLGTADPTDKTFAKQRAAGSILEPLFEKNPNHPGIAHYIIHAYDYPELASGALKAARKYGDIAPWVPHALHMPTHIYTRLGMWDESIGGNIACVEAAREYSKRFYSGGTTMDDLHALDYLMFAYMQTGRDAKAREVLEHIATIHDIVPGNEFASAYALAAMPARYCLERSEWQAAARLKMLQPEFVGRFPFAKAHIVFARAVGAARMGDVKNAEAAVARLAALRDSVTDSKFQWWIGQIEIQHLSAKAWLEHAQDRNSNAEALFRQAAVLEDKAGTHPVTPGQVLPAREQLGELLLETGNPKAALVEFEQSLKSFPRRFRSHLGAARSAAQTGHHETARKHAAELKQMMGAHSERLDALAEIRLLLEKRP
jgi:tetratricopeptide (TPR) repeat protein